MEFDLSIDQFTGVNQEFQAIIRSDLFNALHHELQALDQTILPHADADSLSEVIASMSPKKAEKLVTILRSQSSDGSRLNLSLCNLYETHDKSAEAERFRFFFSKHSFSYLGGNNSKNYLIRSHLSGQGQVLMLEKLIDAVKSPAAEFRGKPGSEVLTPRGVERAVGSNFLVVTEVCTESLDHKISQRRAMQDQQKLAAQVFKEMAEKLIDIEKAGYFFPDAKMANWLIDTQGRLRIADVKTFKSSPKGTHVRASNPLQDGSICRTQGYIPPELANDIISVDKAHAYILGCNLDYALKIHSNIFDDLIGQEFKRLIQDLKRSSPELRISLDAAQKRLAFIYHLMHIPNEAYRLKLIENFHLDGSLYQEHVELENVFGAMNAIFPKDFRASSSFQQFIAEKRQSLMTKTKSNPSNFSTLKNFLSRHHEEVKPFKIKIKEGLALIQKSHPEPRVLSFIEQQFLDLEHCKDFKSLLNLMQRCQKSFAFEAQIAGRVARNSSLMIPYQAIIADFYRQIDVPGIENQSLVKLQNLLDGEKIEEILSSMESLFPLFIDFIEEEKDLLHNQLLEPSAMISAIKSKIKEGVKNLKTSFNDLAWTQFIDGQYVSLDDDSIRPDQIMDHLKIMAKAFEFAKKLSLIPVHHSPQLALKISEISKNFYDPLTNAESKTACLGAISNVSDIILLQDIFSKISPIFPKFEGFINKQNAQMMMNLQIEPARMVADLKSKITAELDDLKRLEIHPSAIQFYEQEYKKILSCNDLKQIQLMMTEFSAAFLAQQKFVARTSAIEAYRDESCSERVRRLTPKFYENISQADKNLASFNELDMMINDLERRSVLRTARLNQMIVAYQELSFGSPDEKMKEFTDLIEAGYQHCTDKEQYLSACESRLLRMKKDPILNGIKAEISRYNKMNSPTGPHKAAVVSAAMKAVPVLERGEVFSDASNEIYLYVQKALAAKRQWLTGGLFGRSKLKKVECDALGRINEQKAATGFINLLKTHEKSKGLQVDAAAQPGNKPKPIS